MNRLRSQECHERERSLTFAPLAWLKLQFFCHAGDTEIGGFGIASKKDLLYVSDFRTVRQRVTSVSVQFEDEAVADFFDRNVDEGLRVEQFSRIWMHTHPGESVEPSGRDEDTFEHTFGRCDWSLMFILGRTGRTYARMGFAAGPGGQLVLPTTVDWAAWPEWLLENPGRLEAELAQWQNEYEQNIYALPDFLGAADKLAEAQLRRTDAWFDTYPWDSELDEVTYGIAESVSR
jgi:hypothetical protein